MALLTGCIAAFGFVVVVFGIQSVLFLPLTVVYEFWKRRFFRRHGEDHTPVVSVIVPAYNEERTIGPSIASILASDYPHFEVIVVNDGSTDGTVSALRRFITAGSIVFIDKANGGKSSALNAGIARASGEIILFTDADSLFRTDTIRKAARWFVDPAIHAVCGNDTPAVPETGLQRLLVLTTHIGTGFVRRALSFMNVMPIISGNTGVIRREWLGRVGGFREIWGEDLDLTFRLQRAGARIVYDSDVVVACDVPRTVVALWKQRMRWTRSYLKITSAHRDMMFRREHFPFSWYLPVNWFSMIVIPLLQLALAVLLPIAIVSGAIVPGRWWDLSASLGFGTFLAIVVYSVLLDRTPGHLKYVPLYSWLVIPLSFFFSCVVVASISAELAGAAERWEKVERRDMTPVPGRRRALLPAVARGVVPALALCAVAWFAVNSRTPLRPAMLSPVGLHQPLLTVATHFDAWTRPGDALTSILRRERSGIVTEVGVGAGRYEWNFFRWEGHESTWSNDQRNSDGDLLGDAVATMARNGRGIVSIVDMYAPKFIAEHPLLAAHASDGSVSTEQVCFTDLVSGEFGIRMREMISYLARSYGIAGISLTELEYDRFCYDDRCLQSYCAFTGETDWPRGFFTGAIDRNAASVGLWRSSLLARYLATLADSVHAHGKKFYVDVPIHYERLRNQGRSSGLYYPGLLAFADALIVWDYFSTENRSPATSEDVARFFVDRYGADRVIMSFGLWGKDGTMSPEDLAAAISASQAGGAKKIWLTPNHLVTDAHWNEILALFQKDHSDLVHVRAGGD
jgi:cellulose synthase/poly-beta-1,6-N-acetylglucosamine synthase-like glycosyltransferase